MELRALVAAGVFVLCLLVGCQPTPPVPATATPASAVVEPSPLADASDCRARIEAIKLDDVNAIDDVDECRFIDGGAQAASDVLAAGGSRDQLWAAVWVYGSSGTDPAPLRPMLSNADASIRVMAAAALVRLGDSTGLAELETALADPDYVVGSYPPLTVAAFAELTLSRYVSGVDAPNGPSATSDTGALVSAWQAWLADHRACLVFDASKGEWAAP